MRILHTMIRVGDLAKAKAFYCDCLGMTVLREKEYPDGKFTLAFLGYGSEDATAGTVIAFAEDPDGHKIELIQRA
jgi:lactoylglutathione lyase